MPCELLLPFEHPFGWVVCKNFWDTLVDVTVAAHQHEE